ncbi:hypothetical protein GCM10027610_031930 [Dactylosporangium cerinum]
MVIAVPPMQFGDAGQRGAKPHQVRVEVGDGVVGGDDVADTRVRVGLDRGQLAQPGRVRGPLGRQVPHGPPAVGPHERHHDLGQQHRADVGRGRLDLTDPALQLDPPGVGDGERGPVRPAGPLLAGLRHEPVPLQPPERGIDLPEPERLGAGQGAVIGVLEVVPMFGPVPEQAEQHERRGHTAHYSPDE